MQKCKNCNAIIREDDKYCRNCGILIKGKFYAIIYNLFTVLIVIGIIFFILLFIASYIVE